MLDQMQNQMQNDTALIVSIEDTVAESMWVTTGVRLIHGAGFEFLHKDSTAIKHALTHSGDAFGSLLRPQIRPVLKRSFSTMLNDSQLRQDHGLQVAGPSEVEQWLVPASLEDDSPYIKPRIAGWVDAFEGRIAELREAAAEEAIMICEQSITHARAAIDRLHGAMRPSIFLLDGGNIRFVWHGEAGAQVGWQFLEAGRIQFVMFGGGDASDDKAYGEAGLESALRQLRASGLSKAVFA